MAYESETNWGFTVPQAGEADSSEAFLRHVSEVDAAILTPAERAQLTSGGQQSAVAGDSYVRDEYLSGVEGHDVFVTSLHVHPVPERVPYADVAGSVGTSGSADKANSASRLSPGAKINGHLFTGASDVTINASDIPGINRVYWGKVEPSQYTGFGDLTPGDIYIKVM